VRLCRLLVCGLPVWHLSGIWGKQLLQLVHCSGPATLLPLVRHLCHRLYAERLAARGGWGRMAAGAPVLQELVAALRAASPPPPQPE
jgi:hypothetical protein